MTQAYIVVGLGNGDEGKGTTVDYLTRLLDAKVNIRFNGSDQAAHHNVLPDGRWHRHSQLGSGMFLPWVETYFSKYMIVNPISLVGEAKIFSEKTRMDVLSRIIINPDCLVVTPIHAQINQIRERMRGDARHGSCGRGIGETVVDSNQNFAIRIRDLFSPGILKEKLIALLMDKMPILMAFKELFGNDQSLMHDLEYKFSDEYLHELLDFYSDFVNYYGIRFEDDQYLKGMVCRDERMVFEGAQGVLLDVDYGFAPYVTKTKTTFENAQAILDSVGFTGDVCRLGITRGPYSTRHGAGPFPTYDADLTKLLPDVHNKSNEWQGAFRTGWLDKLALDYALKVCGGVDRLVITNVDRMSILDEIKICHSYCCEINGNRTNFDSIEELRQSDVFDENCTLAERLIRIRPIYESHHNFGPENIHTLFEEMFGIRVGIISSGPTFKDKTIINNLRD